MLGDICQGVVAELDIRGHCHRADAYDAEQGLHEAVVVGHQQHNLVVPADAEPTERSRQLLSARLQLGVCQRYIALLYHDLVRVEQDRTPE